ncbi:uncharacterized protein N7469_000317 [Penicillium citrinum]|uniref:Uncharacterized protein n=1 Tax=Penicillium citrinum TaxID=5077 RepID=A0A9W9TWG7_PENCI|nr:uncharacterized protein N7469_000317 [Penicillium citrinum]KAJ5241990.1 hypothetical protein N7469_000317 [Penicillium citrinum]
MNTDVNANTEAICPKSPKQPSQLKYTELLRIKPEPQGLNKAIISLFTSEPRLQFQISQTPNWEDGDGFPAYNLWSPAFFGMTLSQLETGKYKLSRSDFIITRSEEDTISLKESKPENLTFNPKNIVGSIDVDPPPLFCCTCCLQYRGWVRLSNNERWRFDEKLREHFQFSKVDESSEDETSQELTRSNRVISWFRNNSWGWRDKEAKPSLPFEMGEDTRLCRITCASRETEMDIVPDRVIAVMNPDWFVFLENLDLGLEGPDTRDIRDLVILTGLAVANLERPGLKK